MLELISLIVHLNPPTRADTIAFMRFSRYGDHPEDYGLELLPDVPEEKILQTLDNLIRRKLMVCLSDRYLALAVDHSM